MGHPRLPSGLPAVPSALPPQRPAGPRPCVRRLCLCPPGPGGPLLSGRAASALPRLPQLPPLPPPWPSLQPAAGRGTLRPRPPGTASCPSGRPSWPARPSSSSASRGVSATGGESTASVGDRLEGGGTVVSGAFFDCRGRPGGTTVVVVGRVESAVLDQHSVGMWGERRPCPVGSVAGNGAEGVVVEDCTEVVPGQAREGAIVPGCVPFPLRGWELDVSPLDREGPGAPVGVWMPHPSALTGAVEEVVAREPGDCGEVEGGAVPPVGTRSGSPPDLKASCGRRSKVYPGPASSLPGTLGYW
eukprot:1335008-Rhodomonas_salina.1